MEGRSERVGDPQDRYKFTGKERDKETGYDYFGARYYDARIGRWLSVDPLAEKYPRWSSYTYCLSNPIALFDPDGMDVWFHKNTNNPAFHKAFGIFQQTQLGKQQLERFRSDSRIVVVYVMADFGPESKSKGGQTENEYRTMNPTYTKLDLSFAGLGELEIVSDGRPVHLILLNSVGFAHMSTLENSETIYHEGVCHIEYDLNKGDIRGTALTALEAHTKYEESGGDKEKYLEQARVVTQKGAKAASYHKWWRTRWLNPVTGQEETYDRMEDPRQQENKK